MAPRHIWVSKEQGLKLYVDIYADCVRVLLCKDGDGMRMEVPREDFVALSRMMRDSAAWIEEE